ncbi:ArnT family glycosyltransferase [Acidipila rosea]|uniref:Dolichyl-phosphate-mannose-protein mannosyltransferase n=1 Tax=Acidipila rosea TaxID=768535 RepID=A0A4R1LEZ5_9BACT|nr:glycosyltransferase family 39 protein [Acidipila rosea]TCK75423.1 dolichyl-phosphate-mannose-protein mannosyltransferase [Acidipila rosea]
MQPGTTGYRGVFHRLRVDILVLIVACCAFLPLVPAPPHLMNDVDAVQAQIARNMLESGNWVTARLDGVAYLEKSPLIYWIMAVSYRLFGVHDWSARLPLALINVALCWVTARFAMWALGRRAALYAGVIIATCVGMFLFTRILIPDAALTLTIALTLWSFLRLLDSAEKRRWLWFLLLYGSIALGLLLKGLIAGVFPAGIMLVYLAVTREYTPRELFRRMRPFLGMIIVLVIAAPWHVLATLQNPPHFNWTMHSGPGEYHGFFWFYFFNEHVFRFLNMRYPRDYNTVPRVWFWLLHFAWLFPWSATMVSAFRTSYKVVDRAGRVRLLCLIWIGFILLFFTLSTTQEYYSLPIYPALAILLGGDLARREKYPQWARILLVSIFAVCLGVIGYLLVSTARLATPGDISTALTQHPDLYTLSLGHMGDLTVRSFAYLRLPLALAGLAVLIGAVGLLLVRQTKAAVFVLTVVMLVFLQAARIALIKFDPYLGSYGLARALMRSQPGTLIEADAYYAFSSVFFYTDRTALLWNGRSANLEYGSYAPNAPKVFIDDARLQTIWMGSGKSYLLLDDSDLPLLRKLVGNNFRVVAESGGSYLVTNPSGVYP